VDLKAAVDPVDHKAIEPAGTGKATGNVYKLMMNDASNRQEKQKTKARYYNVPIGGGPIQEERVDLQ